MKFNTFGILLILSFNCSFGQIKPCRIFSDNMVLQRATAIPVWGTAKGNELITVALGNVKVKTHADQDGRWRVNLPAFHAGGPYELKIESHTDKICFKNVFIGDVWFAAGQSNMEHPMNGWEWIPHSAIEDYKKEITDSDYPEIRLFTVPHYPSPIEQENLSEGEWRMADPGAVNDFSSTAWFFAKELYRTLKIPIGIINSSWGGTPIQAWMSYESLSHFAGDMKLPEIPEQFSQENWSEKIRESLEENRIRRNQISYPDKETLEKVNNPDFDDTAWSIADSITFGHHFGNTVWLRKKINIPEIDTQQQLFLSLGFLNRQSQVYLNGAELGYFQYPQPVKTAIPKDLIRAGDNILTIRIAQPWGESQVVGNREAFFIGSQDHSFCSALSENWRFKNQLEPVIPVAVSYQGNPSFLYNGMVAPVIPYSIKGFIWYQGEANAGQPMLYEGLFKQLITDWRKAWNNDNLPFLFFQTSNIEQTHRFEKPSYSWCRLREAQQKALSLKNTGMVVTLDIGDPYDVHPKNKKLFGQRLALLAFKTVYGIDTIANGPTYISHRLNGDTAIICFDRISNKIKQNRGLLLKGFTIAGEDEAFYEAKAIARYNEIALFSEDVKNPVFIRYAWEDNPSCSLYNNEGLPAAPFLLRLR